MTRYSDIATLHAVEISQDSEGNLVRDRVSTDVFVNRFTRGSKVFTSTRAARGLGESSNLSSKASGLHEQAVISLRTCDYDGQDEVTFNGVEYDVEEVIDNGEFTRLVMVRRLSNG